MTKPSADSGTFFCSYRDRSQQFRDPARSSLADGDYARRAQ